MKKREEEEEEVEELSNLNLIVSQTIRIDSQSRNSSTQLFMSWKNKRTKRHPSRKGCMVEVEVGHPKVALATNKCRIRSKIILRFKDLEIYWIVIPIPLKWKNLKIQLIQFKIQLRMGISPQLDPLSLEH